MGVDRAKLFGDGLAGDKEGFKFVVLGRDFVASRENGDDAVKSFVASSHIGIFTVWLLAYDSRKKKKEVGDAGLTYANRLNVKYRTSSNSFTNFVTNSD